MDEYENSLAVTFDINRIMAEQKERLCTSPDRVYGYMWYLIRNYFGINQTDMGYSFHGLYKKKYVHGLSKSAYSKIENGTTSINFDLIFLYSERYGIPFQHITEFYNYLLHFLYHKGCSYIENCGYLHLGKNGMFLKYNNSSNEYWFTNLKDYKNFLSINELSLLNDKIDKIFSKAKEAVLFEISYKTENEL